MKAIFRAAPAKGASVSGRSRHAGSFKRRSGLETSSSRPEVEVDPFKGIRWLFILAAGLFLLSGSIAFSRFVLPNAVKQKAAAYEKLRTELERSGRL